MLWILYFYFFILLFILSVVMLPERGLRGAAVYDTPQQRMCGGQMLLVVHRMKYVLYKNRVNSKNTK
jgi:hypothetical protein